MPEEKPGAEYNEMWLKLGELRDAWNKAVWAENDIAAGIARLDGDGSYLFDRKMAEQEIEKHKRAMLRYAWDLLTKEEIFLAARGDLVRVVQSITRRTCIDSLMCRKYLAQSVVELRNEDIIHINPYNTF